MLIIEIAGGIVLGLAIWHFVIPLFFAKKFWEIIGIILGLLLIVVSGLINFGLIGCLEIVFVALPIGLVILFIIGYSWMKIGQRMGTMKK